MTGPGHASLFRSAPRAARRAGLLHAVASGSPSSTRESWSRRPERTIGGASATQRVEVSSPKLPPHAAIGMAKTLNSGNAMEGVRSEVKLMTATRGHAGR